MGVEIRWFVHPRPVAATEVLDGERLSVIRQDCVAAGHARFVQLDIVSLPRPTTSVKAFAGPIWVTSEFDTSSVASASAGP